MATLQHRRELRSEMLAGWEAPLEESKVEFVALLSMGNDEVLTRPTGPICHVAVALDPMDLGDAPHWVAAENLVQAHG